MESLKIKGYMLIIRKWLLLLGLVVCSYSHGQEVLGKIEGDKINHCAVGFMIGELVPAATYNFTKHGRVGSCLIGAAVGNVLIFGKELHDKNFNWKDIGAGELGLLTGLLTIRISFP